VLHDFLIYLSNNLSVKYNLSNYASSTARKIIRLHYRYKKLKKKDINAKNTTGCWYFPEETAFLVYKRRILQEN